jgi:ATP-dependent Clp protease adaptor protein ClpS
METTKTHKVNIINDESNSFPYVAACLIKFCDHEPMQAEQCAVIAHHTGKCTVKTGTFDDMYDLKSRFDLVAIQSEIEEYAGDMY